MLGTCAPPLGIDVEKEVAEMRAKILALINHSVQKLGKREEAIKAEKKLAEKRVQAAKQAGAEQAAREKAETEARAARAAKQEQAEYDAAMRRSVEDELRRKRGAKGAGAPSTATPARAEQPAADDGGWQQAPARGGKAKMVETRVTPSPPPPQQPPQPVMPVELNQNDRRMLSLLTSSKNQDDWPGVIDEMRAITHKASTIIVVQDCVRRRGAAGITLGDLKHQLDKELRATEHVGRTLKSHFVREYIKLFPHLFRLEDEAARGSKSVVEDERGRLVEFGAKHRVYAVAGSSSPAAARAAAAADCCLAQIAGRCPCCESAAGGACSRIALSQTTRCSASSSSCRLRRASPTQMGKPS